MKLGYRMPPHQQTHAVPVHQQRYVKDEVRPAVALDVEDVLDRPGPVGDAGTPAGLVRQGMRSEEEVATQRSVHVETISLLESTRHNTTEHKMKRTFKWLFRFLF